MNRSESIQAIAPAFLAAQKLMTAAYKDAKNPHFNSRYSDFASVVDAVKGPLNEHGIAFLQPVRLTAEGVEIETVLMHTSGEFLSETLCIPLGKRDAQSVGSATSYGKRYGLQSLCGLPSDDDDGNDAVQAPPKQKQQAAPPKTGPAQANGAPAVNAAKVGEWRKFLSEDPALDALNTKAPEIASLDAETKKAVKGMLLAHAERGGLHFDKPSMMFVTKQTAGGAA